MVHVACMFYIEIHFYKLALTLRSFTLVVMDLVTFPKLKIVEGLPGFTTLSNHQSCRTFGRTSHQLHAFS